LRYHKFRRESREHKGGSRGGCRAACVIPFNFGLVWGVRRGYCAVPRGDIMAIQGEELALACAKAADEIKAENVRVWDMRGISNLTDYMVVCSGSSMPQLRAVLRDVAGQVEELHGVKPVTTEGKADTRWVVLDYIDVMVHVMHDELREYYGLEDLWKDAKEVTWETASED
jgi:ribosome-associated protein